VRGDRAGERATGRPGALAQGQELVEHAVGVGEAAGRERGGPGRIGDRIDGALENHRGHAAGEHVGIGLADRGAGEHAEEGEPSIADEPPQAVEVADRVGGRDVSEQIAVARAAAPRERRLGQVAPLRAARGG